MANEPPRSRDGAVPGDEPGERRVQSETIRDASLAAPAPSRLCLLVIGDGIVATHTLPASGAVVIGRGHDVDIQIDHPSISRRHATLHLGPPLAIEDLGSANGTRVRDEWLSEGTRAPIVCGEVIDVGSTMIIAQQRATPLRPRRVWTHGYFEARLEEECARAARTGGAFAIARLHCDRGAPVRIVEECLADALASIDVVAYYAPCEYEALLVDTTPAEADRVLAQIARRFSSARIDVKIGVAWYPADGRDPDSLVSRASRAATGDVSADRSSAGVLVPREGAMHNLQRLVERIAASTISVLILGETGVGKEVLAESVHRLSQRAGKPFLRLNCAALSESLLESELFGHERGAFTGATAQKLGLLETAHGGTVFLDEVGELPMSIQVKLLRVIERREVLHVGGLKPRDIDVRFVAATNRDLEAEVARGTFRQDLYFRLNGITLVIPPLRERVSEVAGLARVFLDRAAAQAGRPPPALSREALRWLEQYSWPGNIRELKNMMERAFVLCAGSEVLPDHLPVEKMSTVHATPLPAQAPVAPPMVSEGASGRITRPPPPPGDADPTGDDIASQAARLRRELDDLERQRIIDALDQCVGNQTEAARVLGMSRRTLINKIEAYGIPRPRKGRTRPD